MDRGATGTGGWGSALQGLACAYAFSLAFMQPAVGLFGFAAVASDVIVVALGAVWGAALLFGQARMVGDRAFGFLAAYFAALLLSFLLSRDPGSTVAKLATQLYLLSLPVILCSLVTTEKALRGIVRAWLAGTAVVVLVGGASLVAFVADPAHPLLDHTRFQFGTLPPGDYPRLRLTFLNANMACNYLAMSLALVLGAERAGWLGRRRAGVLGVGIVLAAVTTLSPGFGGMLLLLGLWFWLVARESAPVASRVMLVGSVAAALLFVAAMAVTPILHPTAPFLIAVPGLDVTLAPSPRLMIWIEALQNFAAQPLIGRGVGAEAVGVDYLDPTGRLQHLTDAHNIFLNIAVQAGMVGLAALMALLWHIARRSGPVRLPASGAGVVRLAAGLGLLGCLVYQGLGGSFEDSRHLWFALGMLLAASRIERAEAARTS